MIKVLYTVTICTALLLITGCIKDDYNGPDPNDPSRTVLVYLGGDNSLSATLIAEVEEMRKGWTYTGNRCLIYIDPIDDTPRLLSLRGGCQINPTPYIDTIAVYSEENSASAAVFSRVLSDVTLLHPADSYGLIFASHASGWLPKGTLEVPTRSLGIDNNTGTIGSKSEMELVDFADAIPDGQFDFIIFESCLMAGVEVAYELRNKTDYILASSAELLVPGFVPIYQVAFHHLFNTKQSVENALITFATTYYNSVNALSGAYRSTTLSIIDTGFMDDIATNAKDAIYTYSSPSHNNKSTFSDFTNIQHFDRPGSYGDYPVSSRYFDYLDYMKAIATDSQYTAIETAINKAVVWKAATPTFMDGYNGFAIASHSGMTTFIEQDCFQKLSVAYHKTAWYKATH